MRPAIVDPQCTYNQDILIAACIGHSTDKPITKSRRRAQTDSHAGLMVCEHACTTVVEGDDVATYYDGHEGVYRRLEAEGHACWDKTSFDQFYMRPFLELALGFVGAPGLGARALDVGCGTGPVA